MADSIGNLAVTLSLDAIAFTAGLDQSSAKANTFAAGVSKAFAGISAGLAIGGGTIKGFYDGFKDGLSEIVKTGQEAHRLGVSLEGLAGIQMLAGADAEKMDHALMHMSRTLSEAAQGGMEAKGAFQELHLDASALAKLPLDQSLGKIVNAVNELGSAADRTNAGMKLFGREGVDVLEKLRGGSIGIAEAIAKIKSHGGVGFTERDVTNAIQAEQSIKEMESTVNRIKLALVSEFAPVVKNIADWVADIAGPTGGGMRKVFHDAAINLIEGMDSGVAGMENMVISAHRIEKSFGNVQAGLKAMINPWGIGTGKPVAAQDDFEKEVIKQGQKFHDVLKKSREGVDKVGAGGAAGGAAGGGTELDSFAGKIDTLEKKLAAQVAGYGLAGDAAERFALANLGATEAQLKGVDASIKEMTALNQLTAGMSGGLGVMSDFDFATKKIGKAVADGTITLAGFTAGWNKLKATLSEKLTADALKVIGDSASPLDKFSGHMADLDAERQKGLINESQYALALAKDYQGIAGAITAAQHAPGALQEGTDAAYSATVAFEREASGSNQNIQLDIKSVLDRALLQQTIAAEKAARTADLIEKWRNGKL